MPRIYRALRVNFLAPIPNLQIGGAPGVQGLGCRVAQYLCPTPVAATGCNTAYRGCNKTSECAIIYRTYRGCNKTYRGSNRAVQKGAIKLTKVANEYKEGAFKQPEDEMTYRGVHLFIMVH